MTKKVPDQNHRNQITLTKEKKCQVMIDRAHKVGINRPGQDKETREWLCMYASRPASHAENKSAKRKRTESTRWTWVGGVPVPPFCVLSAIVGIGNRRHVVMRNKSRSWRLRLPSARRRRRGRHSRPVSCLGGSASCPGLRPPRPSVSGRFRRSWVGSFATHGRM